MFKYTVFICLIFITLTTHAALTDPTRPPDFNPATAAAVLGKGLTLEAIFYSANRRQAIINGQTLQAGDTIAGFKLLQIKSQAVLLKGPEGVFEMPLLSWQIKPIAIPMERMSNGRSDD